MKTVQVLLVASVVVSASRFVQADTPNAFVVTNLVSNSAAYDPTFPTLDPNMQDAWGIATRPAGAGGHIWIDNAFTGTSDEYIGDVNGTPLFQDGLQSVSLDTPNFTDHGYAFVTGLVYNAASDFPNQATEFPVSGPARNANTNTPVPDYSGSAKFIFVTEDGAINAWASNTTTAMNTAPVILDYSKASGTPGNPNYLQLGDSANPVYSGIAITSNTVTGSQIGTAAGNHIFAADFRNNTINVFNDQWQNVSSSYHFQTPANLLDTTGKALHVFNIQELAGHLYVTYAAFNPNSDEGQAEIDANGDGAVVEYNEDGSFVKQFIDPTDLANRLDAPWGIAIAPAGFGPFGGDLLVTNFGDNGTISAFDNTTGNFLGKLDDSDGNPISIEGIWGLTFGNGLSDGDANSLYFTAGPNTEFDGVFGKITVTPEPSSFALIGLASIALLRRRRHV